MTVARLWRVDDVSDVALIGWRSWRVLPFETLEGVPTYRLCASGTRGIPKVWPPGQAVEAVCSDFASQHEAPWPDHECGIYAYGEPELAQEHLTTFVNGNRKALAGWAFGRVALWGRVVEHEHGWRAQFAYPFEVTVHAAQEVAEAIRDLYAVEINVAEPLEPEAEEEDETDKRERLRAGAAAIRQELDDIADRLKQRARAEGPKYRFMPHRATSEQTAAVLRRTLAKTGRCAALSKEVAEELAEGDRSLPIAGGGAIEAVQYLKRASMAGLVVQLRTNGRSGICAWTLPGREDDLEPPFATMRPVADRHADFDGNVLEALRRAVSVAGGEDVRVTPVLEQMGWVGAERTKSRECQVAQALIRLDQRLLARASGTYSWRYWNVRA
jgi:hypothetical protein